jgi:hypothetical protein
MFWKDKLAQDILAQQTVTMSWLLSLAERYPVLRVKTVDANGRVPVIQLNRKGEWLKPKEWANMHLLNLKQQHSELHHRIQSYGSDPDHSAGVGGNPVHPVTPNQTEVEELRAWSEQMARNYMFAIDQLQAIVQGNQLSAEVLASLAEMRSDEEYYWLID